MLFRREFKRGHRTVHDSKLRLYRITCWSFCLLTAVTRCHCCYGWSHMDSVNIALPKNGLCPIHTLPSVDHFTWTLWNCCSKYKDCSADTEHSLNELTFKYCLTFIVHNYYRFSTLLCSPVPCLVIGLFGY